MKIVARMRSQKSKGRKSMKLDVLTTGCVSCPLMIFMVLKFQILWQKRQGQSLNAGLSLGLCRVVSVNNSTQTPPTHHPLPRLPWGEGNTHTLIPESVETGSFLIVLGRNLYRLR